MPKIDPEQLTEQQRKWFAAIRDGLERETGKSLAQWVRIAKTCPETKHRARLGWLKTHHGLLQNRASHVLNEAFPPDASWDDPDALKSALWKDAASRAILEAVHEKVMSLTDVLVGQRKTFSAWSRKHQFAAMKPVKGGKARLGFALPPRAAPFLQAAGKESWSERLKSAMVLDKPSDVTAKVVALLKAAWQAS